MHKIKIGFVGLAVLLTCTVAIAVQSSELPDEFLGNVRLILPKIIYAVPGIEMNVYFNNVILVINPANYILDVTCTKGSQLSDRWKYTPDGNDIGEYPFKLEVRDQTNTVIASAHSVIRVLPANADTDANITCLIIGDSLTQASVYPQRVLDLAAIMGSPHLTLIGSRGPNGDADKSPNKFEGYGGWTAERFVTRYTSIAHHGFYKDCGSPFIYKSPDGLPKLDFARYCTEFNNGKAPDVVTILLGCNDLFFSTDADIEINIDKMLKNYDILIQTVQSLNKYTIVGVVLLTPPAASQDAFGNDGKCGQTFWQYKRNQHRLVERMMEKYGSSEEQKIFLVPAYVNLDCMNSYPKDKNGKLCNSVHPSEQGYNQIGDTIYCWLKAVTYPGKNKIVKGNLNFGNNVFYIFGIN